MTFRIPAPQMQIDFSVSLADVRTTFLQEALSDTVRALDVPALDRELASIVPNESLQALASRGLRGELVFAVPLVLRANPRLLGYYRLLYGYSQKEFYTSATGAGAFQAMEKRGSIPERRATDIPGLCVALASAGAALLQGVGVGRISSALLDDLTLLTLGPQLRGGANVKKGAAGIATVFEIIHGVVHKAVVKATASRLEILNAAGRTVLIEFAPDPDIVLREEMTPGRYRELIAIEIKAGSDFSNIHNRLGEAEKSHQKARAGGFVECWTVVNVDRLDMTLARQESPTTNRFYRLSQLAISSGKEFDDFRDRLIGLIGIRS